jgi:cytochrome d ubiquinol oxidase subunit I
MSPEVSVKPMEFLGFTGLGLSVLLHMIFVAITLGVGLVTAIYRHLAYKRSDPALEAFARRGLRVMIVTELFSGVWGTIITVFLAGFFPGLVALATNVLFTPLAIAIASIMIRIPSIAIFWYTWGRISPKIHSLIGWIMALSGFGIPLGFRTLFSEITYPYAVVTYLSEGSVNPWRAYGSPLFWSLYLHTVFATISAGAFFPASVQSLVKDVRGVSIALKYGFVFLILQLLAGPLYWYTLHRDSPYIFNAVTFGYFSPFLILKMVLVVALIVLGLYSLAMINLRNEIYRYTRYIGLIALIVVFLGELLNDGSRYPYIVTLGERGLSLSAFFNLYMDVPASVVFVILGFLFIAIAVFLVSFYYAIVKRFLPEIPER